MNYHSDITIGQHFLTLWFAGDASGLTAEEYTKATTYFNDLYDEYGQMTLRVYPNAVGAEEFAKCEIMGLMGKCENLMMYLG